MQFADGIVGRPPQFRRELDVPTSFARRVKNRAALNPHAEHFLQAKGLRAELRVVAKVEAQPDEADNILQIDSSRWPMISFEPIQQSAI